MPDTRHLGIRDAVAALLMAAPALAGGRIKENRTDSLATGVASQIHVFRNSSTPERLNMGPTAPIDWLTELSILIKARKDGVTPAETVADGLAGDVYSRVMADQTLGGLVQEFIPGDFDWDQDEADTTVATATWVFSVRHRTEFNSLTA